MIDLTGQILELIRLASTDLPPDVEKALRESVAREGRRISRPWCVGDDHKKC